MVNYELKLKIYFAYDKLGTYFANKLRDIILKLSLSLLKLQVIFKKFNLPSGIRNSRIF